MRYCHECGAEVAPEDIFCLYCGITLLPAAEPSLAEEADGKAPTGDLSTEETANRTDLIIGDKSASEITAESQEPALSEDKLLQNSVTELPEKSEKEQAADSLSGLTSSSNDEPPVIAPIELQPAALPDEDLLEIAGEPETVLSQSAPVSVAEQHSPDEPSDYSSPNDSVNLLSTSNKEVSATVPPVIKNTAANKSFAAHNLRDEDLQPTLIGQSAKLLLADHEDEPEVSPVETVEKQIVAIDQTNNLAGENSAPQTESSSVDKEQSLPAISADARTPPAKGSGKIPPVEQNVAPAVKTSAVEQQRRTEANQSPETSGSKSPKLKPLDLGTLLNNRYKVVRRIGGGGMGAVYLAEDQNLGGVLRAVKEMVQAYVDESQQEKAVADFRRESVLLTQLEHPAIPTIYDYFFDEVNGRFYLVMKYISGGDLSARLRAAPEGKLDEGSITTWAIQIADVLDYLHNRQPPIVYRDLKPSNIMLDGATNKAMLIDFGIARWVNKEEKGVTAVGTMGYAPPELFAGNAEPRSDIYSLGATMFHLLTGADPQSNPLLIFDFTKNPRPRQINLMLSVEIEDILLRSVEYNAGLRFESAAKLRDALQEHLERLKAGRLTFERSSHNIAQVMPIPAQAPPSVPFASQPPVNMVFCGFCGEKIIGTDMFCAYCGAPQASSSSAATPSSAAALQPRKLTAPPPQQMQETMLSQGAALPQQMLNVTARLVVLGTTELDAPLFKLEKENNLVGREDRRANIFPEVDLSKFDNKAQVSRRHARIWREGAAYMIEDLKSSNGTVLITDDNQTVRLQANQPHVLQHGDKLKLGETTLRFYVN